MLDQIRAGDTIVVWKLDRLARSTRSLLETMESIREAAGKFRSLSEPWADTTTHAGKMIMTIFAGIADDAERDLIRERTSPGREAAQKRGVRFGRPRKLTLDQSELARRLVLEGKAVSDIARTFNVHSATIYRLADPDSSDVQMPCIHEHRSVNTLKTEFTKKRGINAKPKNAA
jgi:DNA invertase Pin-like site-specific DNA recombinase